VAIIIAAFAHFPHQSHSRFIVLSKVWKYFAARSENGGRWHHTGRLGERRAGPFPKKIFKRVFPFEL
jgi:hypothetical protein